MTRPITRQTAVITGGGTGFGLAAAEGLAATGANVVLTGRRAGKLAFAVARLVKAHPEGDIFATACDVTQAASITEMLETVRKRFGRIDMLINNAAVLARAASLDDLELEEIDAMLSTNLRGPLLVTRAVLPVMRDQGYGRIVNLTSGLAWKSVGGYSVYGAAKAGVNAMTRIVAAELAGWDILINAIDPGVAKSTLNPTGPEGAHEKAVAGIVHLAGLPTGGPTGKIFQKDGRTEAAH